MRVFISLIIVLIAYGLVFGSDDEGMVSISNNFIMIKVNKENARFMLKTTGGDPKLDTDNDKFLIYWEDEPTSYTTLNIDEDDSYIFGASSGDFIVEPRLDGNRIIAKWEVDDIEVEQIIEIATGPTTGNPDTMKITYNIVNKDDDPHIIGIRILLDTYLGENDGAKFSLPDGRIIDKEAELKGYNIPVFWYSFDKISKPTVKSQGTLKKYGLVAPDRVVFANWKSLYDSRWEYEVDEGTSFARSWFGKADSAIALYWSKRKLYKGQSTTFSTMYGLFGGGEAREANINMLVSSPLDVEQGEYFPIIADIENSGDITSVSSMCQVVIDKSFLFKNTTPPKVDIGDIYGGKSIKQTWQVMAPTNKIGKFKYLVIFEGDVGGKKKQLKIEREINIKKKKVVAVVKKQTQSGIITPKTTVTTTAIPTTTTTIQTQLKANFVKPIEKPKVDLSDINRLIKMINGKIAISRDEIYKIKRAYNLTNKYNNSNTLLSLSNSIADINKKIEELKLKLKNEKTTNK